MAGLNTGCSRLDCSCCYLIVPLNCRLANGGRIAKTGQASIMKNDGGGEGEVACHRCYDSLMECFRIPRKADVLWRVLWRVSNHIYGGDSVW